QVGAEGDRGLVAIDADHRTGRRLQDKTRVAAGTKSAVDVDAASTHCEELDGARAEHGNVTSRSASDSMIAVAARHQSRAPRGSSGATREPSCRLSARTFSVASASSERKRSGSQI